MIKLHSLAALAAVLVVGAVTPAQAVQVTYSTTGVFGSSGTALLSQGGGQIRYNPIATTVDGAPTTNALFGSFTTVGAPAEPGVTLVDTFTLTITQGEPAPGGEVVFTSSVGGRIYLNGSQAYVEFDDPLEQSLHVGGFLTTYRILAGGAVEPGPVGLLRRPEPGGDDQRRDQHRQRPEPGTMAMACLALPLLGLGYMRRRRRND